MRPRARLAAALLGLFALLGLAVAFAADSDKGVVADLISKALSSKTSSVSIGAVEGALSSDVTIRDIVVSDSEGPWLKVDKVRLVWRRIALLKRRLEVDQLEIGEVQLPRLPHPAATGEASSGPILPELPLKAIVKAFSARRIVLGAPVTGVAAELTAAGVATLGSPSEGLDLTFDAKRVDAPGAFAVKLVFVPTGEKLTLHANFDEPAGGLVARLAKLPGAPPVKLTLDGEGPLDAFSAKLALAAGPDIGAEGGLDLTRDGAGRKLATKLRAHVSGLLPPIATEVFSGETALDVAARLADDGSISLDSLALTSSTARLDAKGGFDTARKVALDLHALALPGAHGIGAFDFTATASGPIDALALHATTKASDARFAGGRLGALQATFDIGPSGAYGAEATRVTIRGEARASGLALDDPAFKEALGTSASLTLQAEATPDGVTHVSALRLETEPLKASFVGDVSAANARGKVNISAADLSRFAGIARHDLKGALIAALDIDASPKDGSGSASIDAHVEKASTGIAALDGFLGGVARLRGAMLRRADGGFGFKDLNLEGAHGAARIDGEAGTQAASIHAEIDAPSAKEIDARVSGHARLIADLTGELAHLDLAAQATLENGSLMGRPTPRLAIAAKARDLTGNIEGEASLDGVVDKSPATGGLRFAKRTEGGWSLDDLALKIASATIEGHVVVADDMTSKGHAAIRASRLDDLSPLLLTKLGGAIDAALDLDSSEGRQSVAIKAKSASLTASGAELRGLDVDLRISDALGAASAAGKAILERATLGGETVSNVKLVAAPTAQGDDVTLNLRARGLAMEARALVDSSARRATLSRLTAEGGGRRLRLRDPAALAWADDGLTLGKVNLDIDGGRLSLDGRVGATLDLRLAAAALPLSALDLVQPGLGLSGALDANAEIRGSAAEPRGRWSFALARFVAARARGAGLPPLAIKGSGELEGARTRLDATIDAGRSGSLRVSGSAPLNPAGALDLKIGGRIDLALANGVLAPDGRRATGEGNVDLKLTGPATKPHAQGGVTISNGAFADEVSGFKAEHIEASLQAAGETLDVARFAATTPNGGSLEANGRVRLDPVAGFPGSIRLTGRGAQILSGPVIASTADLSLEIAGALASAPKINGRVGILSMDINIPGGRSDASAPLAGTRHIAPGPTARARLALDVAKARLADAHPFNALLDVQVSAPGRIFVRGHGVDAELSGDVKVTGTSAHPRTVGGFDLRRGTFSILGKRLDFTRGRASFHDDPIPDLDMAAQTTAGDVTATVTISGSAAKPNFAFSSQPNLAQDEIVSRILFEKASGSLSPIQALQLANAVASLSGAPDAFEKVRKSLGVDSLDVGSDSTGGATLGVRRALNSRLSIGVTTGQKPEDNGVSLDLDVTKHLRVQSGVNAGGAATSGVGFQWEY